MVPPPDEPGVLELGDPAVEDVEHHVLEGVAVEGLVKNMGPRLRDYAARRSLGGNSIDLKNGPSFGQSVKLEKSNMYRVIHLLVDWVGLT